MSLSRYAHVYLTDLSKNVKTCFSAIFSKYLLFVLVIVIVGFKAAVAALNEHVLW